MILTVFAQSSFTRYIYLRLLRMRIVSRLWLQIHGVRIFKIGMFTTLMGYLCWHFGQRLHSALTSVPGGTSVAVMGFLGIVMTFFGWPKTRLQKMIGLVIFTSLAFSEIWVLRQEQTKGEAHYTEFRGYFSRVSESQAALSTQESRHFDQLAKRQPVTPTRPRLTAIDSILLRATSLSADMWGFLLRRDIGAPIDAKLSTAYNRETVQLYSEEFDQRIARLRADAERTGIPIPELPTSPMSVADVKSIAQAVGNVPEMQRPVPGRQCRSAEIYINQLNPSKGMFGEQAIQTESAPLPFGIACDDLGESTAKVALTGPFYFIGESTQVMTLKVDASARHFGVVFKPKQVGIARGTLSVSVPEDMRLKSDMGNPLQLSGIGK